MSNIFFISDTHFGHANILTFKGQNGLPIRDFHNVHEMDEHMIERWNSVVRPQDKIYHLGDVTMARQLGPDFARIINRLNGHKRLVRGNHDVAPTREYLRWFEEVYACRVLDRIMFTHIPIHPFSLERFVGNAHGHIHERQAFGPKYLNLSVEAVNYTPVSLEDIKKRLK